METTNFRSDRHFTIGDFLISHGQLLIRSAKTSEEKVNIDLQFFDVNYLQIPTVFNGISIEKITAADEILKYPSIQKKLSYKDNHLFEITSNNEKYLIAASFFKVVENELDFNETSLGYK
ncbi:MAG TPA: hypothetical protein VGM31_17200 [Puia sp.]|jgi:hypothetical protein